MAASQQKTREATLLDDYYSLALTCIALNMERMVKASVVKRGTPARVMVRKVANPATIVIEGLIVFDSDINSAAYFR